MGETGSSAMHAVRMSSFLPGCTLDKAKQVIVRLLSRVYLVLMMRNREIKLCDAMHSCAAYVWSLYPQKPALHTSSGGLCCKPGGPRIKGSKQHCLSSHGSRLCSTEPTSWCTTCIRTSGGYNRTCIQEQPSHTNFLTTLLT